MLKSIMRPKAPTPKKRKAGSHGRFHAGATKTSHSSKQRVQRVEAELSELKTNMQAMMQQLMTALRPIGMVSAETPQRRVYKSAVPFSEPTSQQPVRVAKVAGDGACMWHSVAAHLQGFQPDQSCEPRVGHELKSTLVDLFARNASECTGVLGITDNALLSIFSEWRPAQAWADMRLLALVSVHYNVSVIVMNMADARVEMISPSPQHLASTQWWGFEFANDHYEPVVPEDVARIIALVPHPSFEPWYPKQEARGGATQADASGLNAMPVLGKKEGEAFAVDVRCFTWNMGGWRSHVHILEIGCSMTHGGK